MTMNIGVQTFTIRKAQKKSIERSYLPLINMGIKNYEIARIDFNEENALEIKSIIDKYGIEVSSIQVKPKYVFGDVKKIVRFCEITGCKNVVISMLPFDCILGKEERFYKFVDSLDLQYEIYEKFNITLAYHHHNWEYVTLSNGKTRMEELISRTKKIKFVHDTYWTSKSALDSALQIAKFGNRLLGVHLRDLSLYKKGLDVCAKNCAIGDGILDFNRIISEAKNVSSSYFVIEQKTDDPYKDIEKSYEYLKRII